MNSRRTAWISLVLGVVLSTGAFAQAPAEADQARQEAAQAEEYRQAMEARRAAEEERLRRERDAQRMADFLKDARSEIRPNVDRSQALRERQRRQRQSEFRKAFAEFEAAREKLSEALGFKTALKTPASKIEKTTNVFLDLIKSKDRPRLDDSEFEGLTNSELGWEALTTAENLAPSLADVIASESQKVVDVKLLMEMPKLELELLRLRWMARHLK